VGTAALGCPVERSSRVTAIYHFAFGIFLELNPRIFTNREEPMRLWKE